MCLSELMGISRCAIINKNVDCVYVSGFHSTIAVSIQKNIRRKQK